MQVRRLAADDLDAFQEYIRHSEYGDVLQTPAWARLKSASGWRPHFLSVEDDGGLAGACVALERRLLKSPFTLLYCPRGPVLDWSNPLVFPVLAGELIALARERRAVLIKIDPPVSAASNAARDVLTRKGFRAVQSGGFGGVQPRCVMKLDISLGAEAAYESFKPKWRYNIRLAQKKGVVVREGGGSEIDLFYDILLETARRDHFLVRGREYFHTMWRELERDGLIRLFLAEYEGRPISGALMYVMGEQAWYTYGASSNEHRNVMPNHIMQWAMIRAAAAAGCAIYDFRGVSCSIEGLEDDHLKGLNRFKAGFNAEFVEYVGEYDYPVSKGLYFCWTQLAPLVMKLLKRPTAAQQGD